MSRRLVLMRHAKSDWGGAWTGDHDRPLAARGQRDAPLVGRWLAGEGLKPDKALCSTARRARATCELALAAMEASPPVLLIDRLYTFGDPAPLLEAIRAHGGEAETLMLTGHNEAIHELALLLAREADGKHLKRLKKKFPTAAVAAYDMALRDWKQLSPTTPSRLTHHIRPKDLRRQPPG